METTERRYDIDWLRVIAIGLLLVYHISIAFQPWGVFIGFIQNGDPLESLWIPMGMLNIWRIPLLFFVSGMGVAFASRKRNWKQLMAERSRRILVPFLFGAVFIVPIHVWMWQRFYNQDILYRPGAGHLWFLGNLFIYVLALAPFFFFLRKHPERRVARILRTAFRSPLGFLLVSACFVAEALLVKPEIFELYALNVHGFLLGMIAFFFGFVCAVSSETSSRTVRRWRWPLAAVAMGMFLVRALLFQMKAPLPLMAVESTAWIFTALGFAARYLNHPGKTLSYLSRAAYPVYILHMVFLYLGASVLFPLELPAYLKFVLIIIITTGGCFGTYEIIRKIGALRPLFGLKSE